MTKIVSLDFELASELALDEVGADVWTKSLKTVPILCGFAIDDGAVCVLDLTLRPHPPVIALLEAIAEGAEIHAWNASFEYQVWNNICAPRFGWRTLPIERFHCTMAAAACAALPLDLAQAADAMNSPYPKDKAGHALMMRMSRPRGFDANKQPRWWHVEDPAKLAQLIGYNRTDVEAERWLRLNIPRMTARERCVWLADQRMNAKGLPVDKTLLDALAAITLQTQIALNQEIFDRTHGEIRGASVAVRLLEWVRERGYPLHTLAKDPLAQFMSTPAFKSLGVAVRSVLETRAEVSKSSTAKLMSMNAYASHDGIARNLVQYGGAFRTLRWAGRGPQIQNFPRPLFKQADAAIEDILGGQDANFLRHIYGRPLDVVSTCLRGVFKAPEGQKLVICDFHAIEAIVLAWLAEFGALLDVFRRHEDVYVFTAKGIGSTDRQLGKVLRLACGYAMGHVKFQATAASPAYNVHLTLAQAHDAVQKFRKANVPIVELWKACEASAKLAILNPSTTIAYKKVKFRMALPTGKLKGALLIELPSGRNLVYRNARVENGRIVFWGLHQRTHQWQELDTYGGKIVENITQAVARDLLAEAVVNLDCAYPGKLCTTVHDEIVGMTDDAEAEAMFNDMKMVMSAPPVWGRGLPLSAAGGVRQRYVKI